MNKIIAWFGTGTNIAGSFLVALQVSLLGYTLFMLGSVSWIYTAAKNRDKPLLVLNLAFLCANIIGFGKVL